MSPASRRCTAFGLSLILLLSACAGATTASEAPTSEQPVAAAPAHDAGTHRSGVVQPEPDNPPLSFELDPARGEASGAVYQAFLSPHQEPGEEQDTPAFVPEAFRSTKPSLLRSERSSRGHGVVRFSNDLSRAYVDVRVEGIDAAEEVMFHIHCGRPDQLGPIIVDFAYTNNLQADFADIRGQLQLVNTPTTD